MKRLSNIRPLGRYLNTQTGKQYNVKKGTDKKRGTDTLFYLYQNKRVIISDSEFYKFFEKISS